MRIENVNVRVNRSENGPHEVFVSKAIPSVNPEDADAPVDPSLHPNINFAMYLPNSVLGDLQAGQYTLDFIPVTATDENAG